MNRRKLMKLAPVALAAGAVPAAGMSGEVPESRIIALFHRHQALVDEALAFGQDSTILDGADADEILDRMFWNEIEQIEDEMMAIPSQDARDFAAKVIVETARGQIIPDFDQSELFAEARALTGGVA
ncbi:hypothetical protein [Paracoccus siganidrum]|uniref:Uncharacterized protein n=1 Tax=Paracoccus siganidrum TaxID=1276757 RepID=A0A419ACI0_9RHOB|nr:hypothetical protein [Paracoccus siganidrum]RJL22197.1 hypothetical protein D3P05_00785 [Paracoccus siganidrum]RMC26073.1 hypothetical protein C9E82_22830 [Paracoccus siganidrum]